MLLQLLTYMNVYLAGLDREEGQGMAEYALIIALVAVVLIIGLGFLGDEISNVIDAITEALKPAAS
jgi:pilus assembly protein Flp/PilA